MPSGRKRKRRSAASVVFALLALAGCGGGQPEPAPDPQVGDVSAADDMPGDSAGPRSGWDASGGGRADTDAQRQVGESAGASGGEGGTGGADAPGWPADDVVGTVARSAPAGDSAGKAGTVVVTYDVRAAREFAAAVRTAAANWNRGVRGVRLEAAREGASADVRVVAVDGWPGADPAGRVLGRGTVAIGREAVARGHDPARVAAHEFGHMLGLDDRRPGPCSSVMSGDSPGSGCTVASPSRAEVRQVEHNFRTAR